MVAEDSNSTRSLSSTTSSTSSSSNGGSGAPKPMPMAIMRNAHEAIRGAMADIQTLLDKDDFEGARSLWHRFHRFSDLHMKMEEGRKGCNAKGLFRLVDDHADQAAKKADLRHCHMTLYELEEDVKDVFENDYDDDNLKRAKEVYPLFREENESHLKEEESILMPAILRMMKQGVPVKKYIMSDIVPVLLAKPGDMEFFVKFANELLAKHDNIPDKPRVRVFDHGLWAVAATPEQWKEWNAWIKETLSDDKYKEVTNAIEAFKEEQRAKKAALEQQPQEQPKDAKKPLKGILRTSSNSENKAKKGLFGRVFAK